MWTDARTQVEQLPSPGCSPGTLTGCSCQSPAVPEPAQLCHGHRPGSTAAMGRVPGCRGGSVLL